MRLLGALAAVVAVLHSGCATTVHRLGGEEVRLPAGAPRNDCEKREWLTLAPTSREVSEDGHSATVEDGLGMYRVGSTSPESIPASEEALDYSPVVATHREGVRRHDRDRIIAAGFGTAAVVSLITGSVLLVGGLSQTKRVRNSETNRIDEVADIDSTRSTWGAVLGIGGFVLGGIGIAINPDSEERTEAEAARYVYTPADDYRKVHALIDEHNRAIRERCGGGGAEPTGDSDGTQDPSPSGDPAPSTDPAPGAPANDDTAPASDDDNPLARSE